MNYSQSTEQDPLLFFTEVFLFGGYDKVKDSFFKEWEEIKEREDNQITIEQNDGYVVHYFNSNEEHISIPTKVYFADAFKDLLNQQCEISQNQIKRGIGTFLLANQSTTSFLVQQSKILNTLSELNHELLSDVVFRLNSFVKNIIISDVLGTEYIQRLSIDDFFDDQLITVLDVLGYLNGAGINQQKIMSNPDYKRLLFYTIQMVQNESVPVIDEPFEKLYITNELLRYSYYILHVELFGVQPRKHCFTDFLESAFIQMQGIDSLAGKFAQKPKNLPKYVSEIIRKHWSGDNF